MDKLKPCPFCGGDSIHVVKNYMDQHYVCCWDCACVMFGKFGSETITKEKAIEAWNRRRADNGNNN